MRIEIEPLDCSDIGADTLWQLAAYALSNCRIYLVVEDGDDLSDGTWDNVSVVRHGGGDAE